jgi:hypothetical protein
VAAKPPKKAAKPPERVAQRFSDAMALVSVRADLFRLPSALLKSPRRRSIEPSASVRFCRLRIRGRGAMGGWLRPQRCQTHP